MQRWRRPRRIWAWKEIFVKKESMFAKGELGGLGFTEDGVWILGDADNWLYLDFCSEISLEKGAVVPAPPEEPCSSSCFPVGISGERGRFIVLHALAGSLRLK